MPRIIVSVISDLATDQRVRKVCNTLFDEGYEILLIGRKFKKSLPLKRNYPVYRMHLLFTKGFAFYAEYNIRLFFKLLFIRKDILLANDLDTLLPNFLISKLFKKKLVYDSHELFTELPELINRSKTKNIWLKIERYLFPRLNNVYTVCETIAKYYSDKYQVKVDVIRNLPLTKEVTITTQFPFDTQGKKIVLYQGAINKARGLELLIKAMSVLEGWFLIIVGDGDIKQDLQKKVEGLDYRGSIHFMDRQLPENLAQLTPLADVGVSIEEDFGLSYHFALPNKLFDYIHAEVPILVSSLPEMENIINKYRVGVLLKDRSVQGLAKAINTLGAIDKRTWDFKKAKTALNWENESKKLKEIYRNLQ